MSFLRCYILPYWWFLKIFVIDEMDIERDVPSDRTLNADNFSGPSGTRLPTFECLETLLKDLVRTPFGYQAELIVLD